MTDPDKLSKYMEYPVVYTQPYLKEYALSLIKYPKALMRFYEYMALTCTQNVEVMIDIIIENAHKDWNNKEEWDQRLSLAYIAYRAIVANGNIPRVPKCNFKAKLATSLR